ncbi:unnamed protein product [Didymodactylos carnosus]|uniref:PPPDE domain-containing protein n=1 Tax=Didymodactylos carnosus TaxID=1234261 RepID=A0A8S2K967_9BILA|nr:unnamed protein product [Didymodactylos carnosus]CAF3834723.1 unnamed protein product [Didymodactylos carnosus]
MDTEEVTSGTIDQLDNGKVVRLNVYYLTPIPSLHSVRNILTPGLFTPYHSAIEIDGLEYAYYREYAYPFTFSGIISGKPNKIYFYKAYTKIFGKTMLSTINVEKCAHRLGEQIFYGANYNLLKVNCNTFADKFLYELTSHTLPGWISRQERFLVKFLCMNRLFRENDDISGSIVTGLYIVLHLNTPLISLFLSIVYQIR